MFVPGRDFLGEIRSRLISVAAGNGQWIGKAAAAESLGHLSGPGGILGRRVGADYVRIGNPGDLPISARCQTTMLIQDKCVSPNQQQHCYNEKSSAGALSRNVAFPSAAYNAQTIGKLAQRHAHHRANPRYSFRFLRGFGRNHASVVGRPFTSSDSRLIM
jgi:hypothetical protein